MSERLRDSKFDVALQDLVVHEKSHFLEFVLVCRFSRPSVLNFTSLRA